MFNIEQKKLIVELQTSEKHQGMLIGPNDSETCINRCCLGVYAHACGIPKKFKYIDFEYSSGCYTFKDYEKYFLKNDLGAFRSLTVKVIKEEKEKTTYIIDSLTIINDFKIHELFSHKFISKFLFAMPERVFTNFPELPSETIDCAKFIRNVEDHASAKGYDRITKIWKEVLK